MLCWLIVRELKHVLASDPVLTIMLIESINRMNWRRLTVRLASGLIYHVVLNAFDLGIALTKNYSFQFSGCPATCRRRPDVSGEEEVKIVLCTAEQHRDGLHQRGASRADDD